jgi:hypothetical protein
MNRRRFLPILTAAADPAWSSGPAARSALASDGTILINGQRVFPLALYHLPDIQNKAESLRAIKDAGFDIVHSAATREALDELYTNGLPAWCTVGSISPAQPEKDRQRIASIVNRVRDHPAPLYWETEDEPAYQWKKPGLPRVSPEVVRETYAYLRTLDPAHPVYLNHAPANLVSTLEKYNPGGDLIATDVYPVIPHGIREQYALWPDGRQGDLLNPYISQVGAYTRKMRKVAGQGRAVLNALSTLCANGLAGFRLGNAAACDGLRDDLSAPRTAVPIQIEYDETGHSLDHGVEWIAKSAGRKTTWIAVNADPNPVEFTVSGLPNEVEVLPGGKPEWTGSGWRAKVQPFGVPVW